MRRLSLFGAAVCLLAAQTLACGPSVDGPTLVDDRATTPEDEPVTVDVLANDSGVDAATPAVEAAPERGSVEVDGGSLVYTPEADYSGEDRFAYRVEGATAEVTVTVEPVNDPPMPTDDSVETTEGMAVEVAVLENDTDPDGDALSVASVGEAEWGMVSVAEGGAITYEPLPRFDGEDSFGYTVVDGSGASAEATVEVTVEGENDPPVVGDDTASTLESEAVRVDVQANDTDPEGDELTVAIVDPPDRGSAKVVDGEIAYTPPGGYNGRATLVYSATDGASDPVRGTLAIGLYAKLDGEGPVVDLPRQSIQPDELAVVYNSNDPTSKSIAETYVDRRGIPQANLVSVELPADKAVVPPKDFKPVIQSVEDALGDDIQGYALAWLEPYRVGCMGITSAFALGGYSEAYCNTSGRPCARTDPVSYYASETTRPWTDANLRPAMMLAGRKESRVEALIDRGIAADDTFPAGTGYLIRTTDSARSSRWADMARAERIWGEAMEGFELLYRDNSDGSGSNLVNNQQNVMFYLTGLTRVDKLETNDYRPGAVGDHLTSFGGRLSNFGGQMSAVEWLEAGLTGSYGTVVEPCNFSQKFPQPTQLLEYYYRGATLLEAYWKSVHWPGEGVFIGEPLASPWGRSFVRLQDGTLGVETTMLSPEATYRLVGRPTPEADPETVVDQIEVERPQMKRVTVDDPQYPFYTLEAVGAGD